MIWISALSLVFYGSLISLVSSKGDTLLISYESMNCECDQKNIRNVSCGTDVVNEFVNSGTFRFTTNKQIENVELNIELFKQHLGGGPFKPFLMNITFNFCDLLKNRRKNFLINIGMDTLKNTNFWNGCPLNGDYYVEKFYFGPNPTKNLPFPVGVYKSNNYFYLGNEVIMKVQVFTKIFKSKKQVNM